MGSEGESQIGWGREFQSRVAALENIQFGRRVEDQRVRLGRWGKRRSDRYVGAGKGWAI